MECMIEIENISLTMKKQIILSDINLTFEKGKIHGLIGRNGSGKTMLMKCILGFIRPSQGTIWVDHKRIGKEVDFPPHTGVIIETPGFIPHYSGYKNLKVLAELNGKIDRGQILHTMELVGLNPNLRRSVKKYSLGMRQRLGIAQAIMEEPDVLLLDEPTNGLDDSGVDEIRKLISAQAKRGAIVCVASHNKEDIALLSDKIFRVDNGAVREE